MYLQLTSNHKYSCLFGGSIHVLSERNSALISYVRNDPLDQSRQFVATDILSHPRGGEGWDFVAVRVMEIGSDLFCVLSLVFPLGFIIGSGALAHCTFGEVSGVQDS